MMTEIIRWVWIVTVSVPLAAFAQEITMPMQQPDLPTFNCDLLTYATDSPDTARLDFYLQMPYEMLSFSKEGETFRAEYEVSVVISDGAEKTVSEKTWLETISTKNYNESVSNHKGKISQRSFFLRSGKYIVKAQVEDLDTKKTARVERAVEVKNFDAVPFSTSDVMIVSRLTTEGGKTVIVPNVSGSILNQIDTCHLYLEAYNLTPADSVRFIVGVIGVKGDDIQKDTVIRRLTKRSTSCFLPLNFSRLSAGEYYFDIQSSLIGLRADSISIKPVTVKKHILVRWRAMPVTITDLDAAIDQMLYAADMDTIEVFRGLPQEEKSKRFFAFWQRRDPTPNTEQNELMEEYYRRVDYANKNFAVYMEGWRTDRGMIYIIFGPPANIERHPFESDTKPYEVWTYYEQNRQFIFIDQTGFGDYRLQNPGWDTWRNRYR